MNPLLRTQATLKSAGGRAVPVTFGDLTPELARDHIDRAWWQSVPASGTPQEDRDWNWEHLTREELQAPGTFAMFISETLPAIDGAMLYQIGVASILEPTARAAYVAFVAVAPQNRRSLFPDRGLRGVGEELLAQAVMHAYLLGLGGRTILESLPAAEGFYERLGFTRTRQVVERLARFELRPPEALQLLRKRGLIP